MGKKTVRRNRYTAAQRADRDTADDAIKAAGTARLSDPDAVEDMVGHIGATMCARLLSYSLRNMVMLFNQADERGITLTDIEGYKGWLARGRFPNQPGLRINAPNGEKQDGDTGSGETATVILGPPAEHGAAADEQGKVNKRFAMITVWDISQTSESDDFEGEPATPAPVTDAAEMLWDNLVRQAARIGYQVITGDAPAVDTEAATITLTHDRATSELAHALGPLLADDTAHRPRRPQPDTGENDDTDPQAQQRKGVALDLGEFGTARAQVRPDTDAARVYYTVTGTRMSGTWTVWVADAHESDDVQRLNVDYGQDDGTHRFDRHLRDDRPLINGVPIIGGSHGVPVARLDTLNPWEVNCRKWIGGRHDEAAPPRTAARNAAIVRAIARHFLALPQLAELHRAAARFEHEHRRQREALEAARIAERIAELEAERARHLDAAARHDALADEAAQLDLFAEESAETLA